MVAIARHEEWSRVAEVMDETLERAEELERLSSAFAAAGGEHGGVLVIDGPAGIGKSRMLEEARVLARQHRMGALSASGGELEREYPFGVVLDLLEAHLATLGDEERDEVLAGPAHSAAPLFASGASAARIVETGQEFGFVHGLRWLVARLAERRPLALLIDDVHWADEPSLRFLLYLSQRLHKHPVTLVLAIRSGDPAADSDLVARLYSAAGAHLRLRPLSEGAVGMIIGRTDSSAAQQDEVVHATWRSTGGNPFLVAEAIVAARQHPEGWQMVVDGTFAPDSVARNVVTRLGAHGPLSLAIARAAAVLGESSLMTVSQLADVPFSEAVVAAQDLLRAQILGSADPVAFAHPIVRSAIYRGLPPEVRPVLHERAAQLRRHEAGAPDLIAEHLLAAAPSAESWVREALHAGALAAARKGSPGVAVRYLRRALAYCPPDARPPEMLIDLALVEAAAGEATSLERFAEALRQLDDVRDRAEPLYALGHTLYRHGRHAEAAATFREGAAQLAPIDRELSLRFESAYTACAHYLASEYARAMARLEELTSEFSNRSPATLAERSLLASLSLYRAGTGPSPEAAALARRALAGQTLLHEPLYGSVEANLALIALVWAGHPEEARAHAETVWSDARRRGSVLAFAEASFVRALVLHRLGRLSEATVDAQAATEGEGWNAIVPAPHGLLADCYLEQDDLDGAAAVVAMADASLQDPAAAGPNSWASWARGRLRLRRGDPQGALDDFLEAGRILEAYDMASPGVLDWRTGAAVAAHQRGDAALARRLIEEALSIAQTFELTTEAARALRVRALLESEGAAIATLREAAQLLETTPSSLELARSLLELGAAVRRSGHRIDARPILRRARELAHVCGSASLEQRAKDELLASGARPRRARLSGVDSLTPSEARIARLAAGDLSNRAIAETLFLTKNTVEWHLRNVFRKLGVRSRGELREQLEPELSSEPA